LYWFSSDGSEAYVTEKGYSVRENLAIVLTYLNNTQTGGYEFLTEAFDCITQQYDLLEYAEYDRNDKLVKNYKTLIPYAHFQSVANFDRPNVICNLVCNKFRPFSKKEIRQIFEGFDKETRKKRGGQ